MHSSCRLDYPILHRPQDFIASHILHITQMQTPFACVFQFLRTINQLLPICEITELYSGDIGSPNTDPRSFSSGNARFISPPNFPLLRIRSPLRVKIVGQCVNFTSYKHTYDFNKSVNGRCQYDKTLFQNSPILDNKPILNILDVYRKQEISND